MRPTIGLFPGPLGAFLPLWGWGRKTADWDPLDNLGIKLRRIIRFVGWLLVCWTENTQRNSVGDDLRNLNHLRSNEFAIPRSNWGQTDAPCYVCWFISPPLGADKTGEADTTQGDTWRETRHRQDRRGGHHHSGRHIKGDKRRET
jgi:hypothetical protein